MDLTDRQWTLVQPLVPVTPPSTLGGRPPIDDRLVLDAILYKIRARIPWYHLPGVYPSHQTVYRRYQRWCSQGVLSAILTTLYTDLRTTGGLELRTVLPHLPANFYSRIIWPYLIADLAGQSWQISTALIFISLAITHAKRHTRHTRPRF